MDRQTPPRMGRRHMRAAASLRLGLILIAPTMVAWGQTAIADHGGSAKKDADSCYVRQVKSMPGSHDFAADFIEVIAGDPSPQGRNRNVVWGLTADLSGEIPAEDRALYISKSVNGGETWTPMARLDSRYFDAGIDEGLRNGLSVAPGGSEFVITTQKGAFQIFPRAKQSDPIVKNIPGPRVPHDKPRISITKKEGDPVRAAAANMTADGRRLIVGYGYFDMNPQILSYHKGPRWVVGERRAAAGVSDRSRYPLDAMGRSKESTSGLTVRGDRRSGLPPGSSCDEVDSGWRSGARFGNPRDQHSGWAASAACWGVYEPVSADVVARVTNAEFVYHRGEDETGPNIRAYGIEVDPATPSRQVVTALTGVYTSRDGGQNWKRLNDLPEGEYRTAHFNPDGTVIVSGMPGTFLANPFSSSCGPHLRTRVPRGIQHGLRVDGSAPATTLILASPETEFVGMMEQMSEPATERVLPSPKEVDLEGLTMLCKRYGIDILGPLPDVPRD